MRLRKAVAAEAFDLVAQALGEGFAVAALRHAGEQAGTMALQLALAPPRPHGAPQLVGFARREPGRDHRQLHDLFLEDRHPERALEHSLHAAALVRRRRGGARVIDRFAAFGACARVQIRMHHAALDRSGANDRDLDHEVVEAPGFQARQHRHLRAGLDLEHADRIGLRQHPIDRRHLARNVGQREAPVAPARDQFEAAPERRQHAQRQHVDLEQADCIEVVLVPLDHGAVGHRRILDRHQFVQPAAGDHEAADMLRQMARKTDQRVGQFDQQTHRRTVWIHAGLANALGQDLTSVEPEMIPSEPLDPGQRETQGPSDVAQRAAGAVANDGRGQRGTFAAVSVVDVLDHFLTPVVLEIDIDVRRLVALP